MSFYQLDEDSLDRIILFKRETVRQKMDLLVVNHQEEEEFMEFFVDNSTGTAAFSTLVPV